MKKLLLFVFCLITFFTNAQTSFQWAKQIGGIVDDIGYSIALDPLGNAYTVGYFRNTVDFDPGPGTFTLSSALNTSNDIFISKLDAAGNFVWAKQLSANSSTLTNAITIDNSGNVYVTGSYSATVDFDPSAGTHTIVSSGNTDIFILKLNTNGNFAWVKSIGGTATDRSNSIATDTLGNVYTTGLFSHSVDFDPGPATYSLTGGPDFYIFISKLDSLGNFVWAQQFGDPSNSFTGICSGNSLKLDQVGNIYALGNFTGLVDFDSGSGVDTLRSSNSPSGISGVFICKLSPLGNHIWARKLGGPYQLNGVCIAVDANNNVYTTGSYIGTSDFDPGPGVFNMTGNSYTNDIFISKLDVNGNFVWANTVGGAYDDYGQCITTDAAGNVYCTGSFSLAADFDPGPGTFYLSTYFPNNVFILKLNDSGNFVWADQIGGPGGDSKGYSINLDALNNIYTTGYFSYSGDFDCGPDTFTLISNNNYKDIFIHKMGQTPVGLKENSLENSIVVCPNPVAELLSITINKQAFQTLNVNTSVELFNTLGQLVYQENIKQESFNIITQNLKSGIYFLKVKNNQNTIATKKIVKL